MNYFRRLERLRSYRPNLYHVAYDYTEDQLSALYDEFSKFCRTNLKKFKREESISKNIIFCYHQDTTVDGMAGHSYGAPYVFLYRGVIDLSYRFFHNNEAAFNNPVFSDLRAMRQYLNIPLGYLMWQATTLFAFYHERGHIIHYKNDILTEYEAHLSERYASNINNKSYDRQSHAWEFDADIYAADHCAKHLLEFWGNGLKPQWRSLILTLGTAGIIVYWLNLCNGQYDLYYEQGDHPHPLIRSFYVVDAMLKHATLSRMQVNSNGILHYTLQIVSTFYQNAEVNPIDNFFDAIDQHSDLIENFVSNLIAICEEYPELIQNQKAHRRKKIRIQVLKGMRYIRCANRGL